MSKTTVNINKKLRVHFFMLMLSCILGTFLSGPTPSETSMNVGQWFASGLTLAFLTILPLLFFIPTVMKPNPRSVSWLSFFLLAYLVWSILRTFSPGGFFGGALITLFNLTTFTYAVIWLRPFKKAAKAKQNS